MKERSKTISLALLTVFITFSLIKFPDQTFEASIRGLKIWWEVVFPSLLPFFIVAELLISFGVARFIGVLFEPIMRPLFNVPGVGSFAWVMGMASGYPSGAKISVRLREEKQLSQIEAERLLSFTNASSPLFIFGAVSVGFFHDVRLGLLIAVCHYASNALVGICMRFYGRSHEAERKVSPKRNRSVMQAFHEMHQTRMKDQRPFGEVIGDAILSSITTLVMIGGFITLFSVFTKLLFLIGLTPLISSLLQHGLKLLLIPGELALPLLSGLFEISLGTQMISQTNIDSLLPKIVVVSFILGFNGLSVQAQVSSIIAKSDIRFSPYFVARFLHGLLASILTLLLYKPLYINRQVFHSEDLPVSNLKEDSFWIDTLNLLKQSGPLITICFLGIAAVLLYHRQRT